MTHELEPESEDETTALARAVQAGDTTRFEQLYERLLPALFTWATLRVPKARTTVEDFLQEVWYRACRNLQTDAAQRHPFRAWIFVIAKNYLLELLRARPLRSRDGAPGASTVARNQHDATTTTATRLARDETFAKLLDFANTLEQVDHDLFVHCGLEGKSCTAVAKQLDLTSDGAIKRWQRLREHLRELGWLRRLALIEA